MPESQYSISAIISVGESNASFVTWNSSTSQGTTAMLVNADYSYNTLVVTLAQGSTLTAGQVTFQGSLDGVNWFSMEGIGRAPTFRWGQRTISNQTLMAHSNST